MERSGLLASLSWQWSKSLQMCASNRSGLEKAFRISSSFDRLATSAPVSDRTSVRASSFTTQSTYLRKQEINHNEISYNGPKEAPIKLLISTM